MAGLFTGQVGPENGSSAQFFAGRSDPHCLAPAPLLGGGNKSNQNGFWDRFPDLHRFRDQLFCFFSLVLLWEPAQYHGCHTFAHH